MDYRDKPLILIIFGITGDLAQRKLLPALYRLRKKHELPDSIRIVGVSRSEIQVAHIYDGVRQHIEMHEYDERVIADLIKDTETVRLDVDDEDAYDSLLSRLHEISEELGSCASRIYYLSVPAQATKNIVQHLGSTRHNVPFHTDIEQPRLLIEKPFGHDTASARELVDAIEQNFSEQQTFRIDHYLAKETAQNILTFRFQNPLFQSIWNTRHIEKIHIKAHETIGIENRAAFYEQTGALRDILQSHLLQLLALVTMETPGQVDSAGIHRAKLRLMDSIETIPSDHAPDAAVRGQYVRYREEVQDASSLTETFARLKLAIDNEQWRGVEVVLETGKALHEKCTEISVYFRPTSQAAATNALIFRLQPREGITLLLQAKQPGLHNETDVVEMDFDYSRSFGDTSEAYERVIIDAVRGDQALFASAAEVLSSWRIVENVLQKWQSDDEGLILYDIGTNPQEL